MYQAFQLRWEQVCRVVRIMDKETTSMATEVEARHRLDGREREALRSLKALDDAFAEARSPDVIKLIRAAVSLLLRDLAGDPTIDLGELVEELLATNLAVCVDVLLDVHDPKLHEMARLYRRHVQYCA